MSREPDTDPNSLPPTKTGSSAPPTRRSSDYTGQTLGGRYQILRLLGRGGMGWVFLGKHVAVGRPVAIKIVDCERITEKEGCRRLFREARAAAAIGHPSIIDVLDVGTTPYGDPYLVMEYLDGEDLASLIHRVGPLSLSAACGVFEPILQALQVAHSRGVIHRDLKPANIYLVRREGAAPTVKLIDFGISKILDTPEQAKITATGAMIGTPAYMAPEQARGAPDVDARADLYAVGIMLYEVVTGRLPFAGASYNDLIFKILTEDVELPPSAPDGLPEAARAVIQLAVTKDPDRRHQSALELLGDLQVLDAWAGREEALTELARHIESGSAGDDLSLTTQVSADSQPSEVVPTTRDASRAELPDTKREGKGAAVVRERERLQLGMTAGMAALLAGVLVGLLVLWRASTGSSGPEASPGAAAVASAAAPEDGVSITLAGLPRDATVFYDGMPVSMNPFRVEVRSTIVPIRVEAPGGETFVTTVVPTTDQLVQVKLVVPTAPVPVAVSPDSGDTEQPQAPRKRAGKRAAPPESSEIGKSGRGTLFSKKFE